MQPDRYQPRRVSGARGPALAATAAVAWLVFVAMPPAPLGAQSAAPAVTRPVISEDVAPLEAIAPIAKDGHRGIALLRKPPGADPFPQSSSFTAVLRSAGRALEERRAGSQASRYGCGLRRRGDHVSKSERRSAVEGVCLGFDRGGGFARTLPIDRKSVVVSGCSGGGIWRWR
jgi:hypothetical protein